MFLLSLVLQQKFFADLISFAERIADHDAWYETGAGIISAHDRDGRWQYRGDRLTSEILENEKLLTAHGLEKP